ncbi:MAG: helix-turn-helix transcriptional regulator [Actinomycetota bacterium]
MGQSFAEGAGRALRQARVARGLTLRDVGSLSEGAFSPSAVAGYERAERSISLERFCALCAFYGLAPERLLDEIMDAIERAGDVVVDLTTIEDRDPIGT